MARSSRSRLTPTRIECVSKAKSKHEDVTYRELRERNNVAVRKSRAKSRAEKSHMVSRHEEMKTDNLQLKKMITIRLKELNFLRYLLTLSGKPVPKKVHDLLTAGQKDGPLGSLLYSNLATGGDDVTDDSNTVQSCIPSQKKT